MDDSNSICEALDLNESEDQLPSKEFLDLFEKLDTAISGELIEKAWKQYDTISQQILLEGNRNVWMASAFYTTVWQATLPGHPPVYKYSILNLIRLCDTNILDFFDKLIKWIDIIAAPRRLFDRANWVQSNFATSAIVYKKYLLVFRRVFANFESSTIPPPAKMSKLTNEIQLNTTSIFEFLWVAFVAIKKELSDLSENLLNSFNLLLCIIDLVFSEFRALKLEKYLNKEFLICAKNNDFLEYICRYFGGVVIDAKHLRTHWLALKLKELVEESIVRRTAHDLLTSNFSVNKTSLESRYNEKIMESGDIDERFFISPALQNIDRVFSGELDGSSVEMLSGNTNDPKLDFHYFLQITTQKCLEKVREREYAGDPTSHKSYVITADQYCMTTPVMNSHKRLQKLSKLLETFSHSTIEPLLKSSEESVMARVRVLGERLVCKLKSEEQSETPDFECSTIEKRRVNTEHLFYRFLQKVIELERKRTTNKPEFEKNLKILLLNSQFISSIYVSAIEIVLFSYGNEREFPWSATLIDIAPLNFIKIIEAIVRADEELSREMVKYLNRIEECVLEELAWGKISPLWSVLTSSTGYKSITKPDSHLIGEHSLPPSLSFFFRKIFHLSALRLTDLCERIRMEEIGRRRVWTLFDYVLRNETSLMLGRHLDQNMLCCVYIVAKISNYEISFHDIMYHYRHQPQASSRIYRHVLMDSSVSPLTVASMTTDDTASRDSQQSTSGGQYRSRSALPVPDMASNPSAPPTPDPCSSQDFADLIKYYNRVFVARVEEYVRLLSPTDPGAKENLTPVTLLPLPREFTAPMSPRKLLNNQFNIVSINHPQFMSLVQPGPRTMRVDIINNQSPSKNLREMNAIVNSSQ